MGKTVGQAAACSHGATRRPSMFFGPLGFPGWFCLSASHRLAAAATAGLPSVPALCLDLDPSVIEELDDCPTWDQCVRLLWEFEELEGFALLRLERQERLAEAALNPETHEPAVETVSRLTSEDEAQRLPDALRFAVRGLDSLICEEVLGIGESRIVLRGDEGVPVEWVWVLKRERTWHRRAIDLPLEYRGISPETLRQVAECAAVIVRVRTTGDVQLMLENWQCLSNRDSWTQEICPAEYCRLLTDGDHLAEYAFALKHHHSQQELDPWWSP